MPIAATAMNSASTAHGHRAGRARIDSEEDDTEDLHGLLTALDMPGSARLRRDPGSRRRHDLAAGRLGLEALRHVHGVADLGVLQAAATADRARHHRPGVQTDAD